MPVITPERVKSVGSEPNRRPARRGWYYTGVTLAVLLVVGAAVQLLILVTGQNSTTSKSYRDSVTKVVVTSGSGDVQIVADATDQTTVERKLSWSIIGGEPQTHDHLDNGTLNLPGCSGGWNCDVSYVVHVRAGTDATVMLGSGNASVSGRVGSVTVSDDSGDVLVTGAQGAVQVTADSGNVTLHRISAPVTASLGSGNISADGLRGDTASLKTDSGNVNAQFTIDPQSITAMSGSGSVGLSVPGEAPYNVKTSIGSGTSSIDIPTDPSASRTLTATSGSGDIQVSRNSG